MLTKDTGPWNEWRRSTRQSSAKHSRKQKQMFWIPVFAASIADIGLSHTITKAYNNVTEPARRQNTSADVAGRLREPQVPKAHASGGAIVRD